EVNIDVPNTTLNSTGNGESLVSDGTGPGLVTKSLTGTGVAQVSSTANEVNVHVPGSTISNVGTGASLIKTGSGSEKELKSLTSGNGITITGNTNDVQISSALENVGGGAAIGVVGGSAAPTLKLRTIADGDGIQANVVGDTIRLDHNLEPGPGIGITDSGGVTTISVISAPKPLEGGTGISIDEQVDKLVINAATTTLASVGTGTSLVNDGTGPTLAMKSIMGASGSGVTMGTNANQI